MAQVSSFNGEEYFTSMAEHNRLCKENGFTIGPFTSMESIQTVMAEFRDSANFVLVDDSNDGRMFSNKVGRFMRRIYTVCILARYNWDDLKERREKLELCRRIFCQFMSKAIKDRRRYDDEGRAFINLDSIMYRELGRYSMNGVTGLYFMVENDEPVDLRFSKDEWTD